MAELVTIGIPCYNAQEWIAQAINSALEQSWPNTEVIVVDDGSTDNSLEIIKTFGGRLRYETGPNRGGGAARNRLLELARGEWIQYLDADDLLKPQKIARQMSCAVRDPDCDVVYGPILWLRSERGQEICTESAIPEPRDPWVLLARWLLPQTGGALWRKTALQRVGGWRADQPCCQEHELYCRLLEHDAKFRYCDGAFAVYRDLDHSGRITRKSGEEFIRQRLRILERIESHLKKSTHLTEPRRQAVNDARLELARRLWRSDREFSMATYQRILKSDSGFQPSLVPASPALYSIAFRALGFQGAEIVASCARAFRVRWRSKIRSY